MTRQTEGGVIALGRRVYGQKRAPRGEALEKAGIELTRLFPEKACGGVYSGGRQKRCAMGAERMRVAARDNDTRQSCRREALRAGRRPAAARRARLETDIGRCSLRPEAGCEQGCFFSMRPSAIAGCALADNGAGCNDDAANGRVGGGAAKLAAGQVKGPLHVTPVGIRPAHACGGGSGRARAVSR